MAKIIATIAAMVAQAEGPPMHHCVPGPTIAKTVANFCEKPFPSPGPRCERSGNLAQAGLRASARSVRGHFSLPRSWKPARLIGNATLQLANIVKARRFVKCLETGPRVPLGAAHAGLGGAGGPAGGHHVLHRGLKLGEGLANDRHRVRVPSRSKERVSWPAATAMSHRPSLARAGQASHEQDAPGLRVTDQEQEGVIGAEHRHRLRETCCQGPHRHARGGGSLRALLVDVHVRLVEARRRCRASPRC